MKVDLTEKEVLAIQIGLDEMQNTGMWEECIPEDDVEEVHEAMETLRKKLKKMLKPAREIFQRGDSIYINGGEYKKKNGSFKSYEESGYSQIAIICEDGDVELTIVRTKYLEKLNK